MYSSPRSLPFMDSIFIILRCIDILFSQITALHGQHLHYSWICWCTCLPNRCPSWTYLSLFLDVLMYMSPSSLPSWTAFSDESTIHRVLTVCRIVISCSIVSSTHQDRSAHAQSSSFSTVWAIRITHASLTLSLSCQGDIVIRRLLGHTVDYIHTKWCHP